MEDVLLALLWSVADLLFEVLSQVLLEAIVALIDRSIRNVTEASNAIHPMLAALGYFLLGLVFAIPTVRFYPHPIFRPSTFHGISLVISPLVTGLVMSQIGAALRRNGSRRFKSKASDMDFRLPWDWQLFDSRALSKGLSRAF